MTSDFLGTKFYRQRRVSRAVRSLRTFVRVALDAENAQAGGTNMRGNVKYANAEACSSHPFVIRGDRAQDQLAII